MSVYGIVATTSLTVAGALQSTIKQPIFRILRCILDSDSIIYSSFSRRLFANFIDVFVLIIISWLIGSLAGGIKSIAYVTVCIQGIAFYIYTLYFHAKSGQTPGKRVMGLRVFGIDGQPISFTQSLRRNFIFFLGSLPWIIGTLVAMSNIPDEQFRELFVHPKDLHKLEDSLRPSWYLSVQFFWGAVCFAEIATIFISKRRQSIHDFIGKTIVVCDRKRETALVKTAP